MSDELDLDALKAKAKAATPGPWEAELHAWGTGISVDDEQLFIEQHGLTYAVNPADALYIAAASPETVRALVQRVWDAESERDAALAREAKVRELHRSRTIQVLTGDCALGECDHEEDECPTSPFEQCVACDEMAETLDNYYVESHGFVTAYPCPTIRALDADGKESNDAESG